MPSGLELYPHNEKAYRKLLDMLSETRRACIIHPTGTGKAFIAYRYAFDHPKERILWMSPSTYIEQEQEASIRRELPNYEFKNIERMTYQTAMHRAQKGTSIPMSSIARIPSGRVNTMGSKRTMTRPQSSFCFASTSLTRVFTSRAWMPSLWYGVPRRRRFSISSLDVH